MDQLGHLVLHHQLAQDPQVTQKDHWHQQALAYLGIQVFLEVQVGQLIRKDQVDQKPLETQRFPANLDFLYRQVHQVTQVDLEILVDLEQSLVGLMDL